MKEDYTPPTVTSGPFLEDEGIAVVLPENPPAWLLEELAREKQNRQERRQAALVALPALDRLAKVLCERSGQPYKLRALLYSLYNGKPASLIEIVSLDWEIRKDLAPVLLVFGYEDCKVKFFYDALRDAIKRVGQWEWFLAEADNVELLKDYVDAAEKRSRESTSRLNEQAYRTESHEKAGQGQGGTA